MGFSRARVVEWAGCRIAGALGMMLVAATILSPPCGAAGTDLVGNGSFEEMVDGGIAGWEPRSWSGMERGRLEIVVPGRDGGRCVSIGSEAGMDAAWTARVRVSAQTAYELSGWIRTEGVRGAVGALLNLQNLQRVKTRAVVGSSDWERVSVVFRTGAETELELNCLFGGWGESTGKAWYDDVGLREVGEAEFAEMKEMERRRLRLKGREGLEAVPLMGGKGLPKRLMGVGVDDLGKVFVTETVRQAAEEISLLQSGFLHEADMALTTVEEKEAWIREHYSGRIAEAQGMRDQNGDGVVDVGDLAVRSEKIYTLGDGDGDGVFDSAELFAEGFNGVTTGVAHSVTPIGKSVYATIIPDLWRLADLDGDGKAEVRERLVHGFANHIGYGNHDLHSVVRGFDGKIYWSMGDRGLNVVSREGRRWAYPHTGAIVRCNPDGSEFEVYASGLRNCQYFDFDDYGNLFAIDHDADFQGEMERLVYLPEGSDSGWRNYYQYRTTNRVLGDAAKDLYSPWLAEGMWKPVHAGQPAHFLPPIENSWNAPASFSFQPGEALGGRYRGHFLLGGMGVIRAFRMVADGATFRREGEDEVVGGLGAQVLSSAFGPDGRLYFALWNPPEGRSPLWALEGTEGGGEVERILGEGFGGRGDDELVGLLGHRDRRVRLGAQFELVEKGKAELLKRLVMDDGVEMLVRIHGLWGLTMAKCWDAEIADRLSGSSDDELVAQAARWTGEVGGGDGSGAAGDGWAAKFMSHDSPRVKLHGAIACGKLGIRDASGAILDMIDEAGNRVPVLREAGVIGLMGVARPGELAGLAGNDSEAVRTAAVVALRRLGSVEGLLVFLEDASPAVVGEAVRGIYDEAGAETFVKNPEALVAIAEMLGPEFPRAVRVRALAANRRLGTAEAVRRILGFLLDGGLRERMERVVAMDILASWGTRTALDPVDGRHFPMEAFSRGDVEKAFLETGWELVDDDDVAIAELAIGLSAEMGVAEVMIELAAERVLDEAVEVPLRLAWLRWLLRQRPELSDDTAVAALSAGIYDVREAAALHLLERERGSDQVGEYLRRVLGGGAEAREQQGALGMLGRLPGRVEVLGRLVDDLVAGDVDPAIQLDVIEAARGIGEGDEELLGAVRRYEVWARSQEPFGEFGVALAGGDVRRGRSLFLGHTAAQCSKCHALKQTDKQVGPSLQGVGGRLSRAELLESMVAPQATVAPGYGIQSLELKDGSVLAGTQVEETPDRVTLRMPDGRVLGIGRSEIKSMTAPVGVMPEMRGLLSKRELRDLVAFLSSLRE